MELNGISMSKSDLLSRMFSMFSPTPLTILVGRLNYSSDHIILSRSIFDNPFQTKKAPTNSNDHWSGLTVLGWGQMRAEVTSGWDHKIGQGKYLRIIADWKRQYPVKDEDAKSRQRTCSSLAFWAPRISSCNAVEDDIVPIDIVSCVACMVRAWVHSGGGMQTMVKGDGWLRSA